MVLDEQLMEPRRLPSHREVSLLVVAARLSQAGLLGWVPMHLLQSNFNSKLLKEKIELSRAKGGRRFL